MKSLTFEMGATYYLKLDYGNELIVQRCKPPPLRDASKLWFTILAGRERVGTDVKGCYKASLYKDQFKGILKKKRLKITDLPLYVGLDYISPQFTKLIGNL